MNTYRSVILVLAGIVFILSGCDTGNKAVPKKLPVLGFDIPVRAVLDSTMTSESKTGSSRGFITLSGVSDTEFAVVAYCPQLSGFRDNSQNLEAGSTFTVSTWYGDISVLIEQVGNGIVFRGEFPNESGYFRLNLDESSNTFSYVQAITADFPDYTGVHFRLLTYNCIPQTEFTDTTSYSFHTRNMGIMALKAYDPVSVYITSFTGGETFTDQSFSGFIGYDLRAVLNPACEIDISNLDTFVQQVKSNYSTATAWTVDNIDPDGLIDNCLSYYYVIYDKQTRQVGMARDTLEKYSDLSNASGNWYDFGTDQTTPFTGLGWPLLSGDTYSRVGLMDNIFE